MEIIVFFFIQSDLYSLSGIYSFIDSPESVVGGLQLFGTLIIVGSPYGLQKRSYVAALAVFLYGSLYKRLYPSGKFLTVDGTKKPCGRREELA
ncbi:MAG: hypothetical protein HDS37_06925 [Bacteroides sp.]|nr:hypothetical protein [Bacteroides sp.]